MNELFEKRKRKRKKTLNVLTLQRTNIKNMHIDVHSETALLDPLNKRYFPGGDHSRANKGVWS